MKVCVGRDIVFCAGNPVRDSRDAFGTVREGRRDVRNIPIVGVQEVPCCGLGEGLQVGYIRGDIQEGVSMGGEIGEAGVFIVRRVERRGSRGEWEVCGELAQAEWTLGEGKGKD